MYRILAVIVLATLLLVAGCVDDPGEVADVEGADEEPESVDDGEADDEDNDAPAASDEETGDDQPNDDPVPNDEEAGDEHPDGTLEIHHIDVGQADATLLVEPTGQTMLVDSGDWRQDGADVIAYLEAAGITRIDHLVATHAHADHIGGHAAVLEQLEVGAAYDSGVAHTSQTYERYLDAIEDHEVPLYEVREGDEIPFGDVAVTVLNPPEDGGSDLHYNSVTLSITHGAVTYLTTGDAEVAAEERMVDAHGEALEATVYHAGHHGSSTSSTEPFLKTAAPAIAVISSAYDSQYGHPHDEVLERFAAHGIETYWTGVHGDVLVTTDGQTVDVEPATEHSTDPLELLETAPDQRLDPGVIEVVAHRLTG